MEPARIHLRLHTKKMWSEATKAKPGGKRPHRYFERYFETGRIYRGWGGEPVARRVRIVRVCVAACDRGLARMDETVRLGKGRITCTVCTVIGDMLLEAGFSKPLTQRRLSEFLKKRGFDEHTFREAASREASR